MCRLVQHVGLGISPGQFGRASSDAQATFHTFQFSTFQFNISYFPIQPTQAGPDHMTTYKVVVDGSNIATEGRSLPSLNQLDEAVQCFIEEHPGADVLVIVDTSFAHRIDPTESEIFESAYDAGEIITPPAGTIGRGDSFILKVADKLGATVFSNDSFQEFHGTYDWLFDRGRLIGGKPIPGLGWVFTDRTPVRGPRSREAVRDAKRSQVRLGSKEAMRPMPVPKAPPAFLTAKEEEAEAEAKASRGRGRGRERDRDRGKKRGGEQASAVVAVAAPVEARPAKSSRKSAQQSAPQSAQPSERQSRTAPVGDSSFVNESLPFVSFVSEHLPGTEVDGVVDSYASHGFYVSIGDARGYVPLRGAADPMPRSARDVARKGEEYTFIVRAFDAERRGIELAMPGSPAAQTIGSDSPADVSSSERDGRSAGRDRDGGRERGRDSGRDSGSRRGRRRRGRGQGEDQAGQSLRADAQSSDDAAASSTKSSVPRRNGARKATAAEQAAVAKVSTVKASAAKKAAPAPKASAKAVAATAPAKKPAPATAKAAAAAKAPTKGAAPVNKAPVKKALAKTAAPAKAAPAKASTPAKKAVPAKPVSAKAVAAKVAPAKAAPAKKAVPAKAVAAKVAPTKAAPARTVAPKKAASPAKKAAVKAVAPAKKAVVKATAPAKKAAPATKAVAKKVAPKKAAKAVAKKASK